jgi:uncharacterized protein involved in exopolysaccharide biosynthesis
MSANNPQRVVYAQVSSSVKRGKSGPQFTGHDLCLKACHNSRLSRSPPFLNQRMFFMDHTNEFRENAAIGTALNVSELLQIVRTYVKWWAVPAVAGTVLAAAYSLVASREWRATQALIVRPEAASVSEERPGKFTDLSEMKTLQETILELAKSQSVVQATLREVGPPRRYRRPAQWPTALDIEDFREYIDMRPPGGAEFGKTEIFYLSIRDNDRQRASALVVALCKQLEQRMQEIRDQRAQGMVAELERTVAMADADLVQQTEQLSAFEAKIGADLAELRNLNADVGGQGTASQELQTIEAERRANEALRQENVRLVKLLSAAQADPHQLLATPNTLLKSQPSVAQLKKALVAAEVQTASLLGSRSEHHPFVIAAREAEAVIREQLHDEIAVAIRGLTVDVELNEDRDQTLSEKANAAQDRLSRLAQSRAEYSKLVASVANHTRLVEAARKNLADARALQAGARSASVISRIDGVEAGVRPVGPGRKVITAAGGAAGLILGFGFVFLFANPAKTVEQGTKNSANSVVARQQASGMAVLNEARPAPVVAACNGDTDKSRCSASCTAHVGSNVGKSVRKEQNPGLFQGMSLADAIRFAHDKRSQGPRS